MLEQTQRFQITLEGQGKTMEIIKLIEQYGGTILSVSRNRRSLEETFIKKIATGGNEER